MTADDKGQVAIPCAEEWNLLNAAIRLARAIKRFEWAGKRTSADEVMRSLQGKVIDAEQNLLKMYNLYEKMKRRRKANV
jgi:hypothetical protein